jgi:hypothetical protein
MLNRAALIVRPAQPYMDWAKSLDDSDVLPDALGEQTVYLIPEFEDDEQAESVLNQVYAAIFELELHGWHTIRPAWPQDRSLAAFNEWFTIEMHTVVQDLQDVPLVDDE